MLCRHYDEGVFRGPHGIASAASMNVISFLRQGTGLRPEFSIDARSSITGFAVNHIYDMICSHVGHI